VILFREGRIVCVLLLLALLHASCVSYTPIDDPELRPLEAIPLSGEGVKATYFGNTTIFISDGETSLLVDGFVSRPGKLRTFLGKIGPDEGVLGSWLKRVGIDERGCLDAVLVGHAHHDHSLDASTIAMKTGAVVMGNESVCHIHRGVYGSDDDFVLVDESGLSRRFGKFTVTFVPSDHVGAHYFPQRKVRGRIEDTLHMPSRYTNFKCGDVFAIHIAHPDGSILVTTTAGSKEGETLKFGIQADAVFLGIGLLSRESAEAQNAYWKEYVDSVGPKMVIPVHWDDFSRKLSKGLKPPLYDDIKKSLTFVKDKASGRKVRILDVEESIILQDGDAVLLN